MHISGFLCRNRCLRHVRRRDPHDQCVPSPGLTTPRSPSPTVSLVVILFELTGALSHVLPIMISVMVSKWVADYFGKEGIYSIWIAMRAYPWLPTSEFRDRGETAANVMKPAADLVVIAEDPTKGCELTDVDQLVRMYRFHGFPVVRGDKLVGYATKENLKAALGTRKRVGSAVWADGLLAADTLIAEDLASGQRRRCTFASSDTPTEPDLVDLSEVLEDAVLQMRPEMPLELVVSTFQKLVRVLSRVVVPQLTGVHRTCATSYFRGAVYCRAWSQRRTLCTSSGRSSPTLLRSLRRAGDCTASAENLALFNLYLLYLSPVSAHAVYAYTILSQGPCQVRSMYR